MSTTLENTPTDFRQRLTRILQGFGSVAELARAVGVSDNAIYKWMSGRGQPSVANLVALARSGQVSVEWLATGHEPPESQCVARQSARRDEYVFVPRYDVRVPTARGGAIKSQQIVDSLAFKADWVRSRLATDPRNLLLIEAAGDSMSPTLEDSDLLLVDLGEPRFKHDGIYVLRHNGSLVVKRLQRRLDGKLTIKSDNPAYEPQVVAAESVRVIGRAIWAAGRL